MLDSLRRIETPEGIDLELRLAGPFSRAAAWLVDVLIRMALYLALSALLGALGRFGLGLALILVFLLEWLYPVVFEVWSAGATPGKRALGLRVLHDDGTPVRLSASIVRNLLRFVDFLPVLYGVGFFSMLLHPEFRRLGDLAAGTVVVYRDGAQTRTARPPGQAAAPRLLLSREEQRAVLEFAERAPRLSAERAQELAALVEPKIVGTAVSGPDRVHRLYAVANYLAGAS